MSLPFTGPRAQVAHSGPWLDRFLFHLPQAMWICACNNSAPVITRSFTVASHLSPLLQHKPPCILSYAYHEETQGGVRQRVGLSFLLTCTTSTHNFLSNTAKEE